MMKFVQIFILLLFSFLSSSAFEARAANFSKISQERDRQLYSKLLAEFSVEVQDFDQTLESKDIVREFAQDWNRYIHQESELPKKWSNGYSWSAQLRDFLSNQSVKGQLVDVADLELVKYAPEELKGEHSIHDPVLYSTQRVGKNISEVARLQDIRTIVYGGDLRRLASSLGIDASSMSVLPSTYRAWGIDKVFIPSTAFADGVARFVLVVPPSLQYLLHYAKLFEYLGVRPEQVVLNKADLRDQRKTIQNSFRKIQNEIPAAGLDAIVLGYYSVFDQVNQNDELVFSQEKNIGQGLSVRFAKDQRTQKTLLLVRSDLTIWGESSADIIREALHVLNPKNVIFMGSAGGITPKTPLYSVSIPNEFYLEGAKLPLENIVYTNLNQKKTSSENLVLGGRHGHTNSPIEQTKAYVSAKIDAGVTSIDVEQDLIAKVVFEFNQKYQKSIGFGAVNLITDKPQSMHYSWKTDSDLTKINFEKKSEARKLAVLSALQTLRQESISSKLGVSRALEVGRSCRFLYR